MQECEAMETLAKNIGILLQDRGWTQSELAARTDIARPNISRIISGKEQLSIARAERIAKAFNLSLAELLNENLENLLAVA